MVFRSPKSLQWIYPNRIWGMKNSEKVVYLTFDDGPIPELTPWVLDQLQASEVKATFFCIGANVQKHPEIYQRILGEGHQVGNHTMNHENGFKTSCDAYLESMENANKLIESNLFRPPYGRMTKKQERSLDPKYKVVMWSWLSQDYNASVTPEKIIAAASKIKPGDILVFHDNVKATANLQQTLPIILQQLKAEGYSFEIIN